MRRYLPILLLLLPGCGEDPPTRVILEDSHREDTPTSALPLTVMEYDGCEYVVRYYFGHVELFTHKGNCKFCLERRQAKP